MAGRPVREIREFAAQLRLRSSVISADDTLLGVFRVKAMLAIAAGEGARVSARDELLQLLNRPLRLFSLIYPDHSLSSPTWEGQILLAVGFVAAAAHARTKDQAFQALANAKSALPRGGKIASTMALSSPLPSGGNTARLSVKAPQVAALALRRPGSLAQTLGEPRSTPCQRLQSPSV